MIQYYPRLWMTLITINCGITLLCMVGLPSLASTVVAAVLILLVGIPHGAADHRIFQQLYTQLHGRSALVLFYLAYLGLMAFVFILWYFLPIGAFLGFVLISSYHFGQGNFAYLGGDTWRSKGLFVVWGIWIIAVPVLSNFPEAHPVLTTLLNRDLPLLSPTIIKQSVLLLTMIVVAWLLLIVPRIAVRLMLKELLSLLALGVMFWFTPLFLSFAIYFALWHSLPSALDQITFLWQQKTPVTCWRYGKTVLPFSLLALGALGTVFWWMPQEEMSKYWSWLFMFIAGVTLPHMLLLDRVYQRMLAGKQFDENIIAAPLED